MLSENEIDVIANMKESCEIDLEEATRTSYVEGRWVSSDENVEYSIVEPCLPGNGDYSAYVDWGRYTCQ